MQKQPEMVALNEMLAINNNDGCIIIYFDRC